MNDSILNIESKLYIFSIDVIDVIFNIDGFEIACGFKNDNKSFAEFIMWMATVNW